MSDSHSGRWPDDGPDEKELYAYFGRCAYYSQVLEQSFVNLSVGLRVAGASSVTVGQIRDAYELADRKTMGQLIVAARQQTAVPAAVESDIMRALHDRNYLCHSYFVTHEADSGSRAGRAEMIAELEAMTDRFIAVDKAVEGIWIPLWAKFGVTEAHIEAHVHRRVREAKARDRSG